MGVPLVLQKGPWMDVNCGAFEVMTEQEDAHRAENAGDMEASEKRSKY